MNNDDNAAEINVPAADGEYIGLLYGEKLTAAGGRLQIRLLPNNGEIYAPAEGGKTKSSKLKVTEAKTQEQKPSEKTKVKGKAAKETKKETAEKESVLIPDILYEEMTVEQLQAVILAKMAKNGPVTDQMRKDVEENIWHNSLVNWANSFR